MKRIDAYIAADGSVHKDKTACAVAELAHIIQSNLPHKTMMDRATAATAAQALIAAAEATRDALNQFIDPCDFLLSKHYEPVPVQPPPIEPPGDQWTPEEVAQLTKRAAVAGPAELNRLPHPGDHDEWTAADDRLLRAYRHNGHSVEWIARQMGEGEAFIAARLAFLTEHDDDMPAPVDRIDV